MALNLYPHQKKAVEQLRSGSILCGGVGTGKSRTALAYYVLKECRGSLRIGEEGAYSPMRDPKDLYIITTARKRDTLEWEGECAPFLISSDPEENPSHVRVVVDSWNNIQKYVDVKGAFFIFDEQRVVGSGAWVKAFLKIAKRNRWILLSATPGDTWMDYIPVFVANGFYKNKTQFVRRHVVFNRFAKYPKIDKYLETHILERHRDSILVTMEYQRKTRPHASDTLTEYDHIRYKLVRERRWNIFDQEPIADISARCYLERKVLGIAPDRIRRLKDILKVHPKAIVFYNFDYERDILLEALSDSTTVGEWSGHRHDPVPSGDAWVYIVQYTAGAEGWNCIKTDTIIFFSLNYSYKIMLQAAGRIDRLNTPYTDLYYYLLYSDAPIDMAVRKALKSKKNFNEKAYASPQEKHTL